MVDYLRINSKFQKWSKKSENQQTKSSYITNTLQEGETEVKTQ